MSRTKMRVLQLAGYVGLNEAAPTSYEEMSMSDLVAEICAERDQTTLRIAFIAAELAAAFDREHGK